VIRAGIFPARPSRSGARSLRHARIDSFDGKLAVTAPYQQGGTRAAVRHQHGDDFRLHPLYFKARASAR
jgi:hypothetical protein